MMKEEEMMNGKNLQLKEECPHREELLPDRSIDRNLDITQDLLHQKESLQRGGYLKDHQIEDNHQLEDYLPEKRHSPREECHLLRDIHLKEEPPLNPAAVHQPIALEFPLWPAWVLRSQ